MGQGRCAGCGKIGPGGAAMTGHIMQCEDYVRVFRDDPLKALTPEEEYVRWSEEENSLERRQERKAEELSVRFADLDARRARDEARWVTPKDILED